MKSIRALPRLHELGVRLGGERGLETVEYALISGIVIAMLAIAVPPLAQGLLGALETVTGRVTEVLGQM